MGSLEYLGTQFTDFASQALRGDGDVDPFPYTLNPQEDLLYNIHAIGLCAIWTFCDIFILIGRYGRFWKFSYKLHSAAMTLVLTLHLLICTIQAVSS